MAARDQAGFTLLEMLVALVILGLATAMLAGAMSGSLARAQRVETQSRAVALADRVLAELGRTTIVQAGMSEGDDGALRWRLTVVPQRPAMPNGTDLARIDLIIWGPAGREVGRWVSLRVLGS